MTRHEFLQRHRRVTASTLLVAALAAAIIVGRPAAGESPAGTRITHVSVEHQDGDSTVVAVFFDGSITGHRWSHMGGETPRAVVKIAGIVETYRPYEVAVDDGRVHRIRIGHHPELDPPEEHLVFDLFDDRVAITRVTKEGRGLIVVLQRVDTPGGSRPPAASSPAPTAPVPKTLPATPTPTMTPPATFTPTATATPTPTPRLAQTATAPPASPMPPVQPRTVSPRVPTNPPQITETNRRIATVPPSPMDFSGPLLTDLVISHREDGSALVRITADDRIEESVVRFFATRGAPPRNLLVIPGVGLPGEDALLPVRDGLLCEIGVVFTEDGGSARTELTFYLASSEVTFEQAAVKGAHAVVLLRPPTDPHAPLGCEVENRLRSITWRFRATGPPQEGSQSGR